ncbi:transporter associated domain-containing protein, partial [Petrimonas mucosa]
DEYDEEAKPFYTLAPDGSYIFEGKTSLDDFIEVTGVPERDFEKLQEEADTIAGLVLELKGDFPKRKELVEYKRYGFQAEEMSKRRIVKVRYIPPKEENN